jgi:hypothetical protein
MRSSGTFRHQNRALRAHAWGLLAATASLCNGCILPEVDTPPIDPALIEQVSGGGGGATKACVDGSYAGSLVVQGGAEIDPEFYGQCVIEGDLTVDLDEVNAANVAKLGGVKVVKGRVTLLGSANAGKTNALAALQSAKEIYANGQKFPVLPTFPSLSSVERITLFNLAVDDIPGFAALGTVNQLEMRGNAITKLTGFAKLEQVLQRFDMINNDGLASLTGLKNLRNLSGFARFEGAALAALSLPQLEQASQLQISQMPNLTTLSMPNISLAGSFQLGSLPNLISPAPTKLKKISSFQIHTCPKIDDVDWIPSDCQLISEANICHSGPNLFDKVKAWVQASGSPGQVMSHKCN